ncbi:MAG TPA: pitrilysin family protein [Clostridia bacterium]|nr:pitrilysin family protein [Clostridia bacterium]
MSSHRVAFATSALFVALFSGVALHAQAGSARTKEPVSATNTQTQWPKLKCEKYKLTNGLEVILSEDHRLPLVAVNVWYHVGPANERAGRTGFAHLFEHMMFQGSRNVGEKAHIRFLEAAGASDINGTTEFDRTNYFETLPSNQLELALWLESDRMGFLLPTLDAAKLENQRDVVRNERRESVENRPYGLAEEVVFQELFPKGHPYHAAVIGSHADIEAARLDDVREFFRQYYAPNNTSVAIVGDFNPVQAKALVEKYFGPLPSGPPVPMLAATTATVTKERRSTVTDTIELPKVYIAWITDPIFKPGDADADLLAKILGGGKSSRLYERLVYDKQIAQDVQAYHYSLVLGGVFWIEATAKPGIKPDELEAEINAELEAVKRDGVTADELTRARNLIQSNIIRRLQTLGGFGGVADRLNRYNHFLGKPEYLQEDLARYEKVTTSSVHDMLRVKLGANQHVVVFAVNGPKKVDDVPKSAADKAIPKITDVNIPDQEWRRIPPPAGPASKIVLPIPIQFKLNNGLTVLFSEQHNLPIVSARLVSLSGSDVNPANRPGLSSFTTDMLDEGTASRSTLKLANDLAQIGATLATEASSDDSSLIISSLKRNVSEAFDVLSDVALHPAFDPKEIERVRKQRIATLTQMNDEPGDVADRVFSRVVYGDKHPYGYLEIGTEEGNKSITRDELIGFWKTGYVPSNSALVVAGDMTFSEVKSLAEKYLGQWQGTGKYEGPPAFSSKTRRTVFVVDKPDSPQTQLRIGTVGVSHSSPDYVGLRVMNMALGGAFSSRINMNLREKHGYSYGAFSRFVFRRGSGPFVINTGVRGDTTGDSVREIFNEIEEIRKSPFSEAELTLAKAALARSLPALFETTEQTTRATSRLFDYELPLDFYRALPGKVDRVDAAELQELAVKYLVPENLIVVAVGDQSKIEQQLSKLELGVVTVLNSQGVAAK